MNGIYIVASLLFFRSIIGTELIQERTIIMNTIAQTGTFIATNHRGKQLILEWKTVAGKSAALTEIIRQFSNLFIHTYAQQELQFARHHPEAIPNEYFLKSLAPLFENVATINWDLVASKITDIFQNFFTTTDFAAFSKSEELYIFVTAKDQKTGQNIAIMQFITGPEYPEGCVKAGMQGYAPRYENAEVDLVLLNSIQMIIPDIKKIIMHVRATNTKELACYYAAGFVTGQKQGYWITIEKVIA